MSHLWTKPGTLINNSSWAVCTRCGVVKRADGMNKPCRGYVRVLPRPTDSEGKGGE